jgi:hypothetical protein
MITVDDDGMILKTAPIGWQWKNKLLEVLIGCFKINKMKEV